MLAHAETAIATDHAGHPDRGLLLSGLPVRERRIELAGVSTCILEGGEGPPIVLLHGPGEFAARWMRILPGLAACNRVIAPDLPGHGASPVLDGPLNAERVFDWLRELIDATCADAPILLGHLLGGGIAARFAVQYGDRLRHLILVDSFGLAPFRPSPRFAFGLLRFLALPGRGSYDSFMHQCLVDPERVETQLGDRWDALRRYSLDRARDPGVKTAMRTLMKEVGVPPIAPEDLDRISVPTTLIWGRQDRALSIKIAEAASARYGWRLHTIEGAADDPPMEQPDATVRAIRDSFGEPARGDTSGTARGE